MGAATVGLAVVGVPAVAGAAPAGAPPVGGPLSAAQVRALGAGATHPVIVVLRDQETALPDTAALGSQRRAAVTRIQSPVLGELRQLHAGAIHPFSLLDAVSATVSTAEEARLAADPSVAEVVPDVTAHLDFDAPPGAVAAPDGRSPARASTTAIPGTSTGSDVCQEGRSGTELDPQAIETIRADDDRPGAGPTAASLGITGAGVKVAFMAEGIDVDQPNFQRPDGANVIVDQADFTGEGLAVDQGSGGEASLDASSIAAQGSVTYTVPLASGGTCNIVVRGAAPGASLVSLKVFPSDHDSTTTSLLEGIDYAVTVEHVDVLSESFGYNPLPDTMDDLIRQADAAAVAAGTVVDVSTGDSGPTSTQGSPSTDPGVIAAGASTTYRVYAQEGVEGYTGLGAKGWDNDNLSGLSSGGSTEGLGGPDLIAPGDLNWDTANPAPGEFGPGISGGTSEAAPLTSATAALVIQAFRKTHGGASPTPALVKQIILSTTTDLGLPADQQGTGLLDAYKAVLEAESVDLPAAEAAGPSVSLGTSDITATEPTSTPVTTPITVTNTGGASQTVRLAGRTLSPTRMVASSDFPESGASWTKAVTFTVPPGQSYLDTHLSTAPDPTSGYVDIQLIDPSGRFAEAALTQGDSDTANAGVRYPEAGTWTAYLDSGEITAPGTYATQFTATTQTWTPFGMVTPASVTLAPGHSATVEATVTTPAAAGDQSAAIAVTAGGQSTSIPVGLRSLVPFTNGIGRFSTDLTGGNGRGGGPATVAYFAFDVPAGEPELDVRTSFEDGRFDSYSLYLVSPDGETLGHASNQLITGGTPTDPTTTQTEEGAVSHVLAPAAGQWTAIVALANPSSGPATLRPLTGTVDFSPVPTTTVGLPDSTSTVLHVGQQRNIAITVTNHSAVPQAYFLDPRLTGTTTEALTPLTQASGISLPLGTAAAIPQWIVPTDTTSITASAAATAPVTFDMSPYLGNFEGELNGDPQVGAAQGVDSATSTLAANVVTPGDWDVDPALTGTFGSKGSPGGTVDLSMTAITRAFDPTVTTTTGDLWSGDDAVSPVVVGPGQTITLHASITPTAAGAVTGTLFLDTASAIFPFDQAIPVGDQIAAIPYSYTAEG